MVAGILLKTIDQIKQSGSNACKTQSKLPPQTELLSIASLFPTVTLKEPPDWASRGTKHACHAVRFPFVTPQEITQSCC